jgi:hypothetical protein
VAYSTFPNDPDSTSLYGDSSTDNLSEAFGEPHGGYEVACTASRTRLIRASWLRLRRRQRSAFHSAGYEALANAVDLAQLQPQACGRPTLHLTLSTRRFAANRRIVLRLRVTVRRAGSPSRCPEP